MKNRIKYLLLLPLLLASCGKTESSGVDTSKDTVSDITASEKKETFTLSVKLQNIIDGEIANAAFKGDGKEIEFTFQDSIYQLKEVYIGMEIEISHPKYQTKIVQITSSAFTTITLDYPYQEIGKTRYNSNRLFNDWILSSTHTSTGLSFRFSSPYDHFLSSDSVLRFFVNTGSTSSSLEKGDFEFRMSKDRLFVYDYGFVHQETDLSIFEYEKEVNDGKTTLTLSIPYSYLGISFDSIIGVTMIDSLVSVDIESEMIFDEVAIDFSNPKQYARIDKKGRVFANTKNADNPYWISKAQKATLIDGKDYSFASPSYCNHSDDCDDFHFSVEYTEENISFDFIGFGEFKDTEYVQLVIHNNIIEKDSWKLVQDDVIVHVYKDHVDFYNECDEFFSVQNGNGTKIKTFTNDSYVDYGPYFTMNFSFSTSLLPNIHSVYDDFYLMAVEFNEKTLYDGKNYYENFFYKNVTQGDPADMISYALISAPKKRECNLTDEEKLSLIGEKKISFANPKDTKYERADDIYLSVTRNSSSLSFDMVGFGDFSDTEIVTFVLHSSTQNGESWTIQKDDTTLMLSKEEAKIVTGTTDFWVGTRITRGNESSAAPVYERNDGYFTLRFEMPYSEISDSMNQTASLKMYAFEFGFGGVIYNNEPWTKLMRYQGNACGDPAFQKNYISI